MADWGTTTGIGTGIGQGLAAFGEAIEKRRERKSAERDKQADAYEKQAQDIAFNIAQMGGRDAPEAKPLVEDLYGVVSKYNALYPPHETPKFIARIEKAFGKTPGPSTPDPRARLTVGGMLSAAPVRQNQFLQQMNDYVAGRMKMDPSVTRAQAIKEYMDKYTGDPGWKPVSGPEGLPQKGPDGKWYQMQIDNRGNYRRAEMTGYEGPGTTTGSNFSPKVNADTGLMYAIEETKPDGTKHETLVNEIPADRPDMQKWYGDYKKMEDARIKEKQEAEDAKQDRADKKQRDTEQAKIDQDNRMLADQLAKEQFTEASKLITKARSDLQDAVDRLRLMKQNLIAGNRGDQQAQISLLANHIAMTTGTVKGVRVTKAMWEEATESTPYLQGLLARLGYSYEKEVDGQTWEALIPKFLRGIALTPDQMTKMVNLAQEKIENMTAHVKDMQEQYKDILSLPQRLVQPGTRTNQPPRRNPPPPPAPGTRTPGGGTPRAVDPNNPADLPFPK